MDQDKTIEYYMALPYKIQIEYEPDDKMWVAFCPELGRGSCYTISESKEEALSLLNSAKKEILEYALEEGKEIPEPKFEKEELPSGQFVVRVPKTLHRKLQDISSKEGISLNQYVATALAEYIGGNSVEKTLVPIIKSFVNVLNSGRVVWRGSTYKYSSPENYDINDLNPLMIERLKGETKTEATIEWRNFPRKISGKLK